LVALDGARREGTRLAYLFTESRKAAQLAEAVGGTPISERVTFARSISPSDVARMRSEATAVPVEQWLGNTPTNELLQLARDAGNYSRFRLDSRIPVAVFERLYDAWIANSLSGQIAEKVLVTRDALSLTGLVTVGGKNGRADIGLLAVHLRARGHGLGKALVLAALEWGAEQQFREAQVVTQQANTGACRLYASCGYAIEQVEHVLHFWL
jgi:dTDP-4-amino-4,6-dideoxy-D-galactose acyltransferase